MALTNQTKHTGTPTSNAKSTGTPFNYLKHGGNPTIDDISINRTLSSPAFYDSGTMDAVTVDSLTPPTLVNQPRNS